MRVLVTGGRDYRDIRLVFTTLSAIHNHRKAISHLIQGGAKGADAIARRWAEQQHRVETLTFKPDWVTFGKAAGPIRNQTMIDEGKPDLVVAFPGNDGTADMKSKARLAGLEVIEVGQ